MVKENSESGLPGHVAIVPDGNRRWAKGRSLNPWDGHREGVKNVKDVIKAAYDLGIKCLTFYAFSTENLKNRNPVEKTFLYKLFEEKLIELADAKEIHENEVKINLFGRMNEFPEAVRKAADKVIERTKKYTKYMLNFCLAYDGRDEIVDAIKGLIKGGTPADSIDRETVKNYLYTKDVPEVDLIIRTGMSDGKRLSGFMLWDSAYSEFYFTDVFWPDFKKEKFIAAIEDYASRERRHGR
jgi:tritrans,polycis-undecaprenyl-diphosphate synthase [geranylgeranyl-diphosphate specific]